MLFAEPLPFSEALDFARGKRALPASLSSREIAKLDRDLVRRSTLSARLTIADQLDLLGDLVEKISGGLTEGGAIAGGHAEGDRMLSIPEAKAQLLENLPSSLRYEDAGGTAGTIRDFASDARLQLQVETGVLDTLGFGRWQATQNEVALDVNPAWELVRMVEAKMPRPWLEERWVAARKETSEEGSTDSAATGRMVALKNHPIWQALGDGAGGFTDGLGNPWPPFAFNSGMNVIDVPREEAIALGLLGPTTKIEPERREMNASLEAGTQRFDEALQKQLAADPALTLDAEGVLRVRNRAAALLGLLCNAWDRDKHPRGERGRFVHEIDRSEPLSTGDAARLLQAHPDHPTTRAFRDYFEKGMTSIDAEHGRRIDAFLRRLPPYRPDSPLFRGLSKPTLAERDALAAKIRESQGVKMNAWVNSGSKSLRIASAFAGADGPGVVMAAVKVKNSARDLEPLVAALSPRYRHQQEIAFLKGSRFRLAGEKTAQTRAGAAPLFVLEEVE